MLRLRKFCLRLNDYFFLTFHKQNNKGIFMTTNAVKTALQMYTIFQLKWGKETYSELNKYIYLCMKEMLSSLISITSKLNRAVMNSFLSYGNLFQAVSFRTSHCFCTEVIRLQIRAKYYIHKSGIHSFVTEGIPMEAL